MATTRRAGRPADTLSEPQAPQSTPTAYGMPGHDFTLQAIMELQKSVGEMNATMHGMKSSLDGVKSKVDDLVGWKHKIAGALATVSVVFAALGFVIAKASDYITFKAPTAPTPIAAQGNPPIQGQPAPAPAAKPP